MVTMARPRCPNAGNGGGEEREGEVRQKWEEKGIAAIACAQSRSSFVLCLAQIFGGPWQALVSKKERGEGED